MKILISVEDSQGRHFLNEILMMKEIDKSIVVIDDDNGMNIQELIEVLSDQCGIVRRPIKYQETTIYLKAPPKIEYPEVIETTLAYERKKERDQWRHRQKHYRKNSKI